MKRNISYDLMRIVAIILVLYNHLPAYHLFRTATGAEQLLGTTLSLITRINVPLFAMVSGALLLGRTETYHQLWSKRISRMLLVILIFEALLYVEFSLTRPYPISIDGFVFGMFGGTLKHFDSYWFLYAYVGFLFMLPFLRMVATNMRRNDFLWLIGVHIVITTIIPLAGLITQMMGYPKLTLSGNMALSLSSVGLFFYPLIGYWIDRHVDVRTINRRQWMMMTIITLSALIISGCAVYLQGFNLGGFKQDYLGLTTYITTIFAFLLIKRIALSPILATDKWHLSSLITFISPLVFGVYLMDQGLKLLIYEDLKSAILSTIGSLPFSLLWCLLSLLLCGTITYLLKCLPLFRKLL